MSALSFLGLAMKAGKVELGEEYIAMAARTGRAKLILTASDAGQNALARASDAGETGRCPVAAIPAAKAELGAALGKTAVSAAAVTDISFASAFIDKLHTETGGFEALKAELDEKEKRSLARRRETRRHSQNSNRSRKKK